ncbi:MAG: histidinol dehydrogenase [Proteobacteria bacterium]|nr:histidinol dehydrogenase [Pseudomonadota bacterium]
MPLINLLDRNSDTFGAQLQTLLLPPADDALVRQRVRAILDDIEQRGDAALLELSARFDNFSPATAADFEVPAATLAAAKEQIPAQLCADLQLAAERLRDYHQRQLPKNWNYEDQHGNHLGEKTTAVERAVIYAPGGTAAYPSSVLMGGIPATIAGVDEIILTTPATNGILPPITLAAAAIAGYDRVFMLGGAQAIIGFAIGSETLPVADVIVGPGNAYVAEAKRQVFGSVGIDSIAGPSEVLIISDGSADPDWIAADLAAQAEHDTVAQSILISDNREHINKVIAALEALVPTLARADIIRAALSTRGACILADDIDDCCVLADDIAPEHLQIMTADPEQVAQNIRNAGSIFLGNYGSVPFGDYLAGTNHVLPTAGTARFSSPLGVEHFIKRSSTFFASAAGAAALAPVVGRLADAEGLSAHAHSARLRQKS